MNGKSALFFVTYLYLSTREHVLVDPERSLVKAILGIPSPNRTSIFIKIFLESAHDALTHPDHPLHPGRKGIEMYLGKNPHLQARSRTFIHN